MGQCSNAESESLSRQKYSANIQKRAIKALYLEPNLEILLQLNDGSVQRIFINSSKQFQQKMQNKSPLIEYKINNNLYISKSNQLFCIYQINSTNSNGFLQIAQQCSSVKKLQNKVSFSKSKETEFANPIIVIDEIFIKKSNGNYIVILISQPFPQICQGQYVVSLKNLSNFMHEHLVQWQDDELSAIINNAFTALSQFHSIYSYGFIDILISSKGRIYIFGGCQHSEKYDHLRVSNDIRSFKSYFLHVLYGKNWKKQIKDEIDAIKSQNGKYSRCIALLNKINSTSKLLYTQISLRNLKNISNYIESYLQKEQSMSHQDITRVYTYFDNFQEINRKLKERIIIQEHKNKITPLLLQLYIRFIQNTNILIRASEHQSGESYRLATLSEHSQQHNSSIIKNLNISMEGGQTQSKNKDKSEIHKANKEVILKNLEEKGLIFVTQLKKEGLYNSAKFWLEKLQEYCQNPEIFMLLSELELIGGNYDRSDQILMKVLSEKAFLNENIIEDSLHILIQANLQKAIEVLNKYGDFLNQEYKHEYFTGKILLMKALSMRQDAKSKLSKSKAQNEDQQIGNQYYNQSILLLHSALNRKISQKIYLIKIFECLGDIELYKKSLITAEQNYSKAKLVYLSLNQEQNANIDKEKFAHILASLANIQFLRKNFKKSIDYYDMAIKNSSSENINFKNYIIGNMGLVQIYSGDEQQGKNTLKYVLSKLNEKKGKQNNVDYVFFKHELDKSEKKSSRAQSRKSSKSVQEFIQ